MIQGIGSSNVAPCDARFDPLVAAKKTEWDKGVKKALSNCPPDDKSACESKVQEAEGLRDADIAAIEAKRPSAVVSGK